MMKLYGKAVMHVQEFHISYWATTYTKIQEMSKQIS